MAQFRIDFFKTALRKGSNVELDGLSSPAPQSKSTSTLSIPDSDGTLSDLPSPSMVGEYLSAKKPPGIGKGKSAESRESLSSVSASVDYKEGSDYSTPLTSGVATPASTKNPLLPSNTGVSTRRGRTRGENPLQNPSTISAISRARALQDSVYALNPTKKRRHENSEDEGQDDDNTEDAQLARAMQEQEYSASATLETASPRSLRRTSRNAKPTGLNFDAEFSDDDENQPLMNSRASRAKKAKLEPKVELSSGSNVVNFSTPNRGKAHADISDDEDFVVIDSDTDIPGPSVERSSHKKRSSRGQKVIIEKHSQRFQTRLKSNSAHKSSTRQEVKSPNPQLKSEDTKESNATPDLTDPASPMSEGTSYDTDDDSMLGTDTSEDEGPIAAAPPPVAAPRRNARSARQHVNLREERATQRGRKERVKLEKHHPEILTMWQDLENLPKIGQSKIEQPKNINRELKPFQLEGVAWMRAMEKTAWGGGLLGDEMGMGKTIQAVSLIMSDFPAKQPSLVLIPPVALMQWQQEIADYTDGTLKTFVFHGSNAKTKGISVQELSKYNVILMSYNSLESMYRKQEKGFKSRKSGTVQKEKSPIHKIKFHRVILDEAHSIKVRHNLPD